MIGYDVHKPNIDRLNEVINEQFEDISDRCQLYHSDGIELEELKDKAEYLDAVITDPPYVHFEAAEVYSEDDRDLSHMNNEKFMERIRHNFKQAPPPHQDIILRGQDLLPRNFQGRHRQAGQARNPRYGC